MSHNQNQVLNPNTATDTPPPNPPITPEGIVDQLRGIRSQISDITPLTSAERLTLRRQVLSSNEILQASINAIGASDIVSQAVGQPAEGARGLHDESNRWTAVEDELRTLLNGISSANLIRRQRLSVMAAQAFGISKQLIRNPVNAVLKPHVAEIQRLKSAKRRKKAASTPETPAPQQVAEQAKESAT